jgi:hypothetical protein
MSTKLSCEKAKETDTALMSLGDFEQTDARGVQLW